MIQTCNFFRLALLCFLSGSLINSPTFAASPQCSSCHPNWADILPATHPKIQGDLAICVKCHQPSFTQATTAQAKGSAFSASIHHAHVSKVVGDCNICHTIQADKYFGLNGIKGSWGSFSENELELFKEFYENSSTSTDSSAAVHARANLGCSACHGGTLPREGATVPNATCETCHGKQVDIAKKTIPAKIPTANPHKSHQGDIACSICHKPHSQPKSYCNDCHKHFEQVMPELAPRK